MLASIHFSTRRMLIAACFFIPFACGINKTITAFGQDQIPPPNYTEVKAYVQYVFDTDRDAKVLPKRERRNNKLMYTTGGIKSRALPTFQDDAFWGTVFRNAAMIEVTRQDLRRDFWREWIQRSDATMREVVVAKTSGQFNSDQMNQRLWDAGESISAAYKAALDRKSREEGLDGAEEINIARMRFVSLNYAYFRANPDVPTLKFWPSGSRKYYEFQRRRGNQVNEGWQSLSKNDAGLFQMQFVERVTVDFQGAMGNGEIWHCRNLALPEASTYNLALERRQ